MDLIRLDKLKSHGIEKKPFGHGFVYRFPESKDMPALIQEGLKQAIASWNGKEAAFYFHLPFCSKQCAFCHYYKEGIPAKGLVEKYLLALKEEIKHYRGLMQNTVKVQSVFFGGGTPTILSAEQLNGLLDFFRSEFPFSSDTEVSIESSPETVTVEKLTALKEGGFNRLSIGVQDFDNAVLEKCGRPHSVEQAKKAVAIAREAGFDNVNIDLIYGLPGQSVSGWEKTLDSAEQVGVESITASDLRVQQNTEFFSMKKESFPKVEEMRAMYYGFVERFSKLGFVQQFPYQFVKKGKEMQFLENQWNSGEFIGFGASSCSFVGNWDYNNVVGREDYTQAIEEYGIGARTGKGLGLDERMKRFVALGLKRSGINRSGGGIDKSKFRKMFGIELEDKFGNIIEKLEGAGLLEINEKEVLLSYNGLFFHDEIGRMFF